LSLAAVRVAIPRSIATSCKPDDIAGASPAKTWRGEFPLANHDLACLSEASSGRCNAQHTSRKYRDQRRKSYTARLVATGRAEA
jgi:hypothetical protein